MATQPPQHHDDDDATDTGVSAEQPAEGADDAPEGGAGSPDDSDADTTGA